MDDLKSWQEEKSSAHLYRVVAEQEAGTARQGLFLDLAREAEKQAGIWEKKIREAGGVVPQRFKADLRTRIVCRSGQKNGAAAIALDAGRDEGARHVAVLPEPIRATTCRIPPQEWSAATGG